MTRLVATLLLSLAACGGSSKSSQEPAPAPISNTQTATPPAETKPVAASTANDVVMSRMIEFRDALCSCTDIPCVERVSKDMTAYAQQLASSGAGSEKMTPAQEKLATEIGEKMGQCMTALMQAGSGGSAP